MEHKLLDKLMPNTLNPKEVQDRIDKFLSANPNIDENSFNEILADIELVGLAKGFRTRQELNLEIDKIVL